MKKLLLLSLTILLFSCGDNEDSIDETPTITLIGEATVTVEIYSTYTVKEAKDLMEIDMMTKEEFVKLKKELAPIIMNKS